MKRSFFDKMFIVFLLISILTFTAVSLFTNLMVRRVLVQSKEDSLLNQTGILIQQYVNQYISKDMTIEKLNSHIISISDSSHSTIWITNAKGKMILRSDKDLSCSPKSLDELNCDFSLKKEYHSEDHFFGYFNDDVISVGFPVYNSSKVVAYVLIHTSFSQINDAKYDIMQVTYIAFFVCILVTLLFLYHFTRTILVPLNKINVAANEFANGNFDTKLDIHDQYEIGQLATSLDNMAGELSKLDQYRKDFIANVSHDFRSPLTSIKGYIEAILDGTIPPELQEHYLQIVLKETNRLTKLTTGLLTLNDFDSYGPILKYTKFCINKEIQSCIQSFEMLANKKSIEIVEDFPEELYTVRADKEKIKQVLYNLLDNAIKFSPNNSKIFITLLDRDDHVEIFIRDNGLGMNQDQKKHIFDRFYKADTSRGRDKLGTGLGLSIVREIIYAHKESIKVQSEIGKGSEFSFTLHKA